MATNIDRIENDCAWSKYGKPYNELTEQEQDSLHGDVVDSLAWEESRGHGIGCYCWACCH